jgi:simple sugar transport system ATP-binding protein
LSTQEAIKKGVHMCSKDRASNGVIKTFNIEKNISLPFLSDYSVGSLLRFSRLKEVARKKIDELGIVCQSEDDDIDTLSGGNQQKVMVGRWLIKDSELLILDEPFQGVDIQARRDIGSFIRKTAKGRGTIVFVAELDEALEIADRVIVMNNKAILGDHLNNNINLNKVLSEITSEVKL